MSQESVLDLQIVRVDGIDLEISSLGCYVSLDDQVVDVITPINSQHDENKICVPAKGMLKFIVKSMCAEHEYIGSVCLPVDLLPSKGYLWLPLLQDSESDLLTILPEETESARILISLNKATKCIEVSQIDIPETNEIVQEVKEEVCECQESFESTRKSFIQTKGSRFENRSEDEKSRFTDFRWHDEPNADIEKFRIQYKKQVALQEDLTKCLVSCQNQLITERKQKELLESSLNEVKQKHETTLAKSQSREKSLLKLLEIKDSELKEFQGELKKLQSTLRTLEGEKVQLGEVVEKLEIEISTARFMNKSEELQDALERLEESEKQRQNLQEALSEVGKEWINACDNRTEIENLEEERNELADQLEKANEKVFEYKREIDDIKEEIEQLKEAHERESKKRSIDHSQQINDYKAQIVQLEEQVRNLNHKVYEERQEKETLSTKLFESQESLIEKAQMIEKLQKQAAPSVESLVQQALVDLSLERDFIKQSNGLYLYNGAEVALTYHEDKIMVKLGTGLIDIEEYIRLSFSVEVTNKNCKNVLTPSGQIPPQHKRYNTSEVKPRYDHKFEYESNDSCQTDSTFEFDMSLNTSNIERKVGESPSKRFLNSTLSSQNKFIKRVPRERSTRAQASSVERKCPFRL
ncbi:unnamed protein product [Blepharisma stoltei]|uniref:Uncharacterized protein n=1 Tax=Blepharisma stoltei TaxID=1481888 RepID=A0AAU9J216_9CILI|nr:unnamed protein product [Blepharisma stoltei]